MTEHERHMFKVKNTVMLKQNEKILIKPKEYLIKCYCCNGWQKNEKDKKRKANHKIAKEGIAYSIQFAA